MGCFRKINVLPNFVLQFILAAKWLVRHSSSSMSRHPAATTFAFPSLLSLILWLQCSSFKLSISSHMYMSFPRCQQLHTNNVRVVNDYTDSDTMSALSTTMRNEYFLTMINMNLCCFHQYQIFLNQTIDPLCPRSLWLRRKISRMFVQERMFCKTVWNCS